MTKVETETGKMITALRDGLHGLHLSRMALVGEAKALRLAGRKAEREKVWARVEEITAQIEVSTKELAEHMLRFENETRTANSRPTTKRRQPRTEWPLQAQKKVAAIWVAWRRNHNTLKSGGREIDCFEEHKDTLPVCIKTAKDFQNCKECARKHGLIPKKGELK